MWTLALVLALTLLALTSPTEACSLCDPIQKLTFRQEATLPITRLILHGTIANPRTTENLAGQTDFHIKEALRFDPAVKGKTVLVLPRFLPVNDKANPPHYLLFCDVVKGMIDPHRGVCIAGPATAEYVKKSLVLNPKDTVGNLVFFFRYLDDPDPEVSRDAFTEFAKTTDGDIAQAATKLDPDKLHRWLQDPKTPNYRLGVYAMLLGACGKEADLDFLRSLLDSKEDRFMAAADGILAGFMLRKPREAWEFVHSIVADGRKPLLIRLAVFRTLRFGFGARPRESRPEIVKAMRTVLRQGDLADIAVEDLRTWKMWDLTPDILKVYGTRGYDAPLVKRAIVRYALCSPQTAEVKTFIAQRWKVEKELIEDVKESLKYEKP